MDRKAIVAVKGVMAVFAIGVLGSVVFAEEPPKRILVDADPSATEALLAKLKEPLPSDGLDFPNETPLEEVVEYLRSEYDVEIRIDAVSLDEEGLAPDDPVAVSARNIKFGVALRMMLEPLNLTYVVRDGVISIVSQDIALTQLSTVVYPVADLLHDGDFASLVRMITVVVAADTWAENGGGDAEVQPYPQRGCLVVSQTTAVHQEIEQLLDSLRKLQVDPNAKAIEMRSRYGSGGGAGCDEPDEEDQQARGGGGFGWGAGGGGGYGGGGGSFRVSDDRTAASPINAATEEDPFGDF